VDRPTQKTRSSSPRATVHHKECGRFAGSHGTQQLSNTVDTETSASTPEGLNKIKLVFHNRPTHAIKIALRQKEMFPPFDLSPCSLPNYFL